MVSRNPAPISDDVVLAVRGVSKKFCRTLKRSMSYGSRDLVRNLLGLRIDGTRLRKDEFLALSDVSFEARKGETLGIIGSNGSGKSTLLRILTGIFPPDSGEVWVRGRVGALIALGAGFHPHMTGRENIYLNGTILGMTREEIDDKFETIVAFSDLGSFIDAPVSTYSSGMYVRLGFSIACHVNVSLLLVDEVLSVGDLAFQAKSTKKLHQHIENGGTVVFVSHNLVSVQALCNRTLWLERGQVRAIGPSRDVINEYQTAVDENILTKSLEQIRGMDKGTGDIRITRCVLRDANGAETTEFTPWEAMTVELQFETAARIVRPAFWIAIGNQQANLFVASMLNDNAAPESIEGCGTVSCRFDSLPLIPQVYTVQVGIRNNGGATLLIESRTLATFRVIGCASGVGFTGPAAEAMTRITTACVVIPYCWTLPDGSSWRLTPPTTVPA